MERAPSRPPASTPSARAGWAARGACALAAVAALAASPAPAGAQERGEPAGVPAGAPVEPAPGDGADFGPELIIEAIEIVGNVSTADRLIRRALPIREGDALRAGDPRLQKARYRVLALGYFRSVDTELARGSSRGRVVLRVVVVERGTIVLDALYFGTSLSTPWWVGLHITERNLLGTGLGLGAGAVYAAGGDIEGGEAQRAFTLRLDDSSVLGTPVGVHGAVSYLDASEPFRVRGDLQDGAAANFQAFSYSRLGFVGGVSTNVTPLSRVTLDARVERVRAALPDAPARELPDGSVEPVDLGLQPGRSRVIAISVGVDIDTRPDPVLPYTGSRLVVLGEIGARALGGSYDYGVALARYERWWSLGSPQHVVSAHVLGGLVVGDAPLFHRLHVSDFNRLLTPRALGLVVSTTPPRDLLGAGADEVTYGDVAASAVVEYSYRLFRSKRRVYGGNLFVGGGLVGVGVRSLPIDVMIDAGLRIDTEIGIFELTFANALGRVPL